MKNIKILLLLISFAIFSWNVSAATIDKIEATSNNNIEVTASQDVVFSDINVKGEIKLLKDIPVSFSAPDSENFKKIVLNLSTDLTSNTSYSLITILGADWNIDFSIWEFLNWEMLNPNLLEWEDGIEKVSVIDSRTLEVYFTTDLIEDTFEFKILSEIETSSLTSVWDNMLDIEISRNLEKSTAYILMILSLEDAVGEQLVLDEDLYDFVTSANLEQEVAEEEVVIATEEEQEEEVIEWNIEEIALESAETPETWTTTWILIIIAVIANLAFFLRKKFIK